MLFAIRRRSTGKIVETGFANRTAGKPLRDALNKEYYKKVVPENFREFYIVRTENHWLGKLI